MSLINTKLQQMVSDLKAERIPNVPLMERAGGLIRAAFAITYSHDMDVCAELTGL